MDLPLYFHFTVLDSPNIADYTEEQDNRERGPERRQEDSLLEVSYSSK